MRRVCVGVRVLTDHFSTGKMGLVRTVSQWLGSGIAAAVFSTHLLMFFTKSSKLDTGLLSYMKKAILKLLTCWFEVIELLSIASAKAALAIYLAVHAYDGAMEREILVEISSFNDNREWKESGSDILRAIIPPDLTGDNSREQSTEFYSVCSHQEGKSRENTCEIVATGRNGQNSTAGFKDSVLFILTLREWGRMRVCVLLVSARLVFCGVVLPENVVQT